MELDYYGQLESRLDDLLSRVKMLEDALTKLPQINFEVDPSRPAGVIVEPAALNGL